MAIATRCPSCETVFRVTPQQLQAHQGQVRCGRCMTVFDGFLGLATLPDPAAAEIPVPPTREPVDAPEPPAAAPLTADTLDFGLEPVEEEPAPASEWFSETEAPPPASGDADQEPVVPEQPQDSAASLAADSSEFVLEPVDEEPAPAPGRFHAIATAAPTIVERARMVPVALDADEGDPYLDTLPLQRRTWPWWAGGTLLVLVLLAQAAYYYRSTLAAQYPVLKPALVELCLLAGCRVPLPQRPRLINIEASDLQVVDPTRPGVIRLTATLRNHASHDVGYPMLDLVLTNTREHTLARRMFTPQEYLESGRDLNAGIPAKAEVTVGIDLDTGDLGAAGFRLDLLPVPAR